MGQTPKGSGPSAGSGRLAWQDAGMHRAGRQGQSRREERGARVGGVLNVEISHLCMLTSLCFKRGKISSLRRHLHFRNTTHLPFRPDKALLVGCVGSVAPSPLSALAGCYDNRHLIPTTSLADVDHMCTPSIAVFRAQGTKGSGVLHTRTRSTSDPSPRLLRDGYSAPENSAFLPSRLLTSQNGPGKAWAAWRTRSSACVK
jgi:hypothetical protein